MNLIFSPLPRKKSPFRPGQAWESSAAWKLFSNLLMLMIEGISFPASQLKISPVSPGGAWLIDSSRHFMPLEVIKRNIDALGALKMNVFHWHLSDGQGFRVECKSFPRLHRLGSDGLYYTQEQIKEVIAYPGERGIRVIPEFDIPGHSTSWLVGYPELASAPGPYLIERKFGVFGATFNPTIEKTYQFFDRFFREMASLFPDPYIHIGGDEVEGKQWILHRPHPARRLSLSQRSCS